MFNTPQAFYNIATKYAKAFPRTFDEFRIASEKVKRVVEIEQEKVKTVVATYNKMHRGDASMNEVFDANKKVQDILISARFAAFMSIPGAIFALPFAIEASKEFDFELLPNSVVEEFNL